MKKIYIPSKGRANSPETVTLFNTIAKAIVGSNYELVIVVEPQEAHEYLKFVCTTTRLQLLEENDKGVAYVFKVLYDQIFLEETEPCFLMDDDINGLYEKLPLKEAKLLEEVEGGNQKTMPLDRIKEVFDFMSEVPHGVNSLSFRHTQWLSKLDYDNFGRICTVICFNKKYMEGKEKEILNDISKYDINKYRLYLENYVPACFLKNGVLTAITYKFAQFTVPMAKNQGGAYDDYNNSDQPLQSATEVARLIGKNFAKVITNKGRTEVKIDWKGLYNFYSASTPLF